MSTEIKSHIMCGVQIKYKEKHVKHTEDACRKCSFFEDGCALAPPCNHDTELYFKVVGITPAD